MASTVNEVWIGETGPGSERNGVRKVISLRIRLYRPIDQSEKAFSQCIRRNDGNFLNHLSRYGRKSIYQFSASSNSPFLSQAAKAAKQTFNPCGFFVLYMIFQQCVKEFETIASIQN